ncbi:hypothetical protein CEXT_544621 [Caerostris extrusa]|uniref:Uncharacterized protein n=1 Tax=Caerostris extrusa TaxID=172846 RepID=A0AAV4NZK8_CAEEX|nr:hypothetical protein CEXT_544621 [Caerostris extrusa]
MFINNNFHPSSMHLNCNPIHLKEGVGKLSSIFRALLMIRLFNSGMITGMTSTRTRTLIWPQRKKPIGVRSGTKCFDHHLPDSSML